MQLDYDKLCRLAEDEFKEPYFFQTEYSDPGSLKGHAQLRRSDTTGILEREMKSGYNFNQGIFIDIFPLDNIIDDERKFNFYKKYTNRLKRLAKKCSSLSINSMNGNGNSKAIHVKNRVKKFAASIIRLLNLQRKAYSRYEKLLKRFNNTETKTCGYLCLDYSRKWLKYPQDLMETVWVPFEFINVPIPAGYDRTLRESYGNYMEIVREKNIHGDVIFNTDVPYDVYLKELRNRKRF